MSRQWRDLSRGTHPVTSSAPQSDAWSAKQYVTFEDERTRPVRDLLAALPAIDARNAIDIGCGPGNSTELLAARFPGASVSGIDTSPDMIAAARTRLPGLRFELEDVNRWIGKNAANDAAVDVILANAVLQWVPDHAKVFPALLAKLAPGGALAVQMPDNLEEPAHRLMRELAADGPWASKLAATVTARSSLGSANWYYALLRASGCKADIWRTTYSHVLSGGAAAVVEWFMGSGLRPFIAPLDGAERADFLARYQSAVAQAYPAMSDGSVLLPFPRLFIVGLV
jgi:trans-aconitate 2-methyltransferase